MRFQPAIFSVSLGRAWLYDLENKIEQASKAGFKGIEIFYEDLDYSARKLAGNDHPTTEQILEAADHCHKTCQQNGLTIIGMQPFLFYEGLTDRAQHAKMIEKMKLWLQIAKRLHTDVIQIPSHFVLEGQEHTITEDREIIASDLRELADMGLAEEPPIRFAYENLCWAKYIDTWESLWDIVKRVDRPNFGMCLDTFNIAGSVWADPSSPTGKTPNADVDLELSLRRLVEEVDVNKVFYIQIVDAERLSSPLVAGHEFYTEGQPSRMSWSRNARAFAFEEEYNAYLPVEQIANAIIDGLGYRGYISMELFSRTLAYEGEHIPAEHAQRGMRAWKRVVERLKLQLH
ncbi:uncharacterized protein E0L32_001077 [Thyridium curvatum]|uniref:Xylose isomerase-like TIM barrel domain-containing protein n=1 Tax=Thyridium curvatum TaxID=1093900 RepID=A0A507B1U2_9PEZI|nr:uncharacterized protein E0L32_001077 [Thyridium curvatum]TPX11259.1 hypothetical protein E0L32_001077 [Thyridium curvatum]